MPYQEPSKRSELFHPHARYFLLLRNPSSAPKSRSPSPPLGRMPGALPELTRRARGDDRDRKYGPDQGVVNIASPDDLLGYLGFRFDTEETISSRDAEVIYCYEVQLAPSARGKGLGGVLMGEFEGVGRGRGVDKGMLTCLKSGLSSSLSPCSDSCRIACRLCPDDPLELLFSTQLIALVIQAIPRPLGSTRRWGMSRTRSIRRG